MNYQSAFLEIELSKRNSMRKNVIMCARNERIRVDPGFESVLKKLSVDFLLKLVVKNYTIILHSRL